MKIYILFLTLISILGCSEHRSVSKASLGTTAEDLPAIYNRAHELFEGDDPASALKLLESVQKPNGYIHELKAILYLEEPKTKNIRKGFISMTLAAEANMPNSQHYLGLCLRDGDCGFPKNSFISTYWLNIVRNGGTHQKGEAKTNTGDVGTRYKSELEAYKTHL